jgi:hypothetical protein
MVRNGRRLRADQQPAFEHAVPAGGFAIIEGRASTGKSFAVIHDARALAGRRVVLAGDDRQLASIERGGLFTELRQRHGAAEPAQCRAAA